LATILMASGDEIMLEVLSYAFRAHSVATVSSGEEAILKAAARRPSAVILDADLSGMSGTETCASIKSDPELCAIPVVLMANRDKIPELALSPVATADCYFAKPLVARDLVSVVEFLMSEGNVPDRPSRLKAFLDAVGGRSPGMPPPVLIPYPRSHRRQ
jgi:twitching motility two-component system response regulator PilH